MKLQPYRTVLTLLLFGGMVLLALWFCPEAARAGVAPVAIGALSSLGLYAAGKSAFEHHVNAKAGANGS
jgi:hypothetical protein